MSCYVYLLFVLEVIIAMELKLVLLGSTGSHKTAVKNIILGKDERNDADTSTTTTATEQSVSTVEVAGRKLTVVDTPDLFSPGVSLAGIGESEGPQAFLLVLPANYSEDTMQNETQVTVSKMEGVFGERCWRNTLILFTVSDEQVEFTKLEDLELVQKCGKRFHCLNIMESGDGSQVLELLEKIEKMVEGNRNAIQMYQSIRDMERERHGKNSRIRDVQYKMQEILEKYEKHVKDLENDLKKMEPGEREAVQREIVGNLKTEYELKRDIGEHIKKMYDNIAGLEENREFIKVILPENQQTLWLSLHPEKYNALTQLEEEFSRNIKKIQLNETKSSENENDSC